MTRPLYEARPRGAGKLARSVDRRWRTTSGLVSQSVARRMLSLALSLLSLSWLGLGSGALLAPQSSSVHAQEPANRLRPPSRYRLIFAPAEQIEQLARGEYWPMRRSDFHERIEALQQQVPPQLTRGVVLRQARYTARLENRRLLIGTASWELKRLDEPDPSETNAPTEPHPAEPQPLMWMVLGRMNLALSDSRWLADRTSEGTLPEADLGQSPDGECLVAVPRSATLQARWTLAPTTAPGMPVPTGTTGQVRSDDEWTFELLLPRCPVSRLDLQLPADLELSVEGAVVRPIPLSQDPAAAESGAGASSPVNLWQIDLGGRHQCQLRFRHLNAPRPQVRFRELTRYHITEQGLDVTAELVLDCDELKLDRLELRADPPLRITRVAHESQTLAWTERDAAGAGHITTVEFPQPLSGLNRKVQISAVAPPQIAPTWTLPRIRVEGIAWLQESARLQIDPPLILQDLQFTNGVRMRTSDTSSAGPHSVWMQFFDPEHRAELRLGRDTRPATFKSATTVTVGPNELSATMEIDVRSHAADQFDVEGRLVEGWNLDSVEAAESDVLDQWQMVTMPDGERLLRLRFQRPLANQSWTRLTLRARRAFKPGPEPVEIRQLRPVEFANDQLVPRQFLSVPPQAGVELVYPRDGRITWLSLDDLDTREAHLLGSQAGDRLILLDRSSLAETVMIREAPERLAPVTARLETTVHLSRREVKERLRIELARLLRPPQHFHVQLSQSRSSDIRWALESAPQQELSAERMADTEHEGGSELWRIAWPETTDETIVIIGERSGPSGGYSSDSTGTPIALARVVEAESQEGMVVVEGASDIDLSINAPPLFTPLPVPSASLRRFEATRRRYRYAPDADIFSSDNWLTVRASIPRQPGSRLVIWRQLLETHLDQSGVHRAEVRLWTENLGADRLRLRLPPDSLLRQTHVNTQEITTDSDLQGWLEIPLPPGERFPLVKIRYDQPGRGLKWLQPLRYEAPQLTAPVLHEQWDVWTPPDYRLSIGDLSAAPGNWFPPRWRSSGERPFNLFSLEDWRRQWSQLVKPQDRLTRPMILALESLGDVEQSTAGDWLRRLAANAKLDIHLDASRLAELGIQPTTALPASTAADTLLRGIDRLAQLHLSLLEVDGTLWLTTESALGEIPAAGATFCRRTTSVARLDGPAAAFWRRTTRRSVRPADVAGSKWQEQPATWQVEPAERAPYIASGWKLHHVPLSQRTQVTVLRTVTWRVLGHASFLVTLAVAWWWARRAARSALFVPIAALAAALLAPAPAAGLGAFAFAGGLLGWLLPRFGRRVVAADRWPLPAEARRPATVQPLLVLLALVAASSGVHAQTPAPGDAPYEVFVPSDSTGKPQGDQVYVPLQLHRQLLNPIGATPNVSPAWVLVRATYTGALEPQAEATQLRLTTLTADFELHVARLGSAVQFPLAAAAVGALKREAFLDGRRIQLQWDANRSTLALPIQQAGRHHLQLSFQTITSIEEGRARVELPIPSTPWATLVLTSAHDPQAIEVPSARGAIQRREATGQVIAELGAADRLTIEWPASPAASPEPAITQLSWLRLERDEARYDVQLIPDMESVLDASLVLEVDERLQLDVALSDQPLSLAPAMEPGVRRLEFDLVHTDSEPPVIELSFVLTGATGIGQVRLPRCRVLNQSVRHWLAVSADPRLGLTVTFDAAVNLPIKDFVERWGGTQSPHFAYELPTTAHHWSCEGQWIESLPNVELQEAYVVGRDGTRLLLVATVRTDDLEPFQQTLHLPPDLRIESIQRLPSAAGAPLRWARFSDDRVTIFFDDPPIGTFQIGILGYRPDATLQDRPLPRIEFPRTRVERRQVDIFRDSEVLFAGWTEERSGPVPELAAFLRNQIGLARWQARYDQPDEIPESITLVPNERVLRAQLDSVIARQQATWEHRLQVQVDVEQGVLDSLTFELPETWTAGLQENAEMRITYAQAPQPGMVRVTIWPQRGPLDPSSPILFSGPIPVTAGQPLSVPNIRLLDSGQIERRIFLPSRLEGQAILWSVAGLEAVDGAEPPAALAQPDATYLAYRIPEGSFQAKRLPANASADEPNVSLLDLQVATYENGRYRAVAAFDLQPDGLDECLIRFPPGVVPVATYLDELPVSPPESAEGESDTMLQRVSLVSHDLPQRLRVVVAGRAAAEGGRWTIALPQLGRSSATDGTFDELPVAQTLVSLYQLGSSTIRLEGELVGGSDLDVQRLDHLCDVFEQAALLATDYSATDLEHWYSTWGRRYFVAQRRLQSAAANRPGDETMSAAVQRSRQRHAAVLPQLKVDTVARRLQSEGELTDSMRVWVDALPVPLAAQYQKGTGGVSELAVQFQPTADFGWMWRITSVLLAIAAGVTVQRWPRNQNELAPRWPMVAGVLFGLAWWLWLEPSLFGWVIVGLSLLVMLLLP